MVGFAVLLAACAGSGSGNNSADQNPSFLSPNTSGGTTASAKPPPQITGVSPSTLFPGEVLTIQGSGFGDVQLDTSRIFFSTDGINTNLDAGPVARTQDWTDSELRIAVPSAAVTGPVAITLDFRGTNQVTSNQAHVNVKRAFDPNATPKLIFVNPASGQFVGPDAPITVIFDRPILLTTVNVTAFSLTSVAQPNPNPFPGDMTRPAEGICERPVTCDLRDTDLIKCTCTARFPITGITDVSTSLRAVRQTAFQLQHDPLLSYQVLGTDGVTKTIIPVTFIISVNATVKSDGRFNPDGSLRDVPAGDIPSTGEFKFFFVD